MRIDEDYYLIVDLEATCSNDGSFPRNEMEIIEIGAVMQSSRTFEIESEFQSFIRPVRHPKLTDFCTELTGIQQSDVANAPTYAEVIAEMSSWMSGFENALFCSWGDYDRSQFLQDCEYHHVGYPFGLGHLNLKSASAAAIGRKKTVGVQSALHFLRLKFEGSHHRGLDDAKNIARIVRKILINA